MIEQGENIKYIQTHLGHSSPTVTLNVYAHLMKPARRRFADSRRECLARMETKWRPAQKKRLR
jgi:integrase